MARQTPGDSRRANQDVEFYLRLLAAVAASDGHIHRDEIRKLNAMTELAGGDRSELPRMCREAEASLDHPLWFIRESKKLPQRSFLEGALRDALLLATVGAHTNHKSVRLVYEAASMLGLESYVERLEDALPRRKRIVLPVPDELTGEVDVIDEILDRAGGETFEQADGFIGRVYFRLLAAVAAADGDIQNEEIEMISDLLELCGVDIDVSHDVCDAAMDHRVEPLWFLAEAPKVSKAFAYLCLRDANILALASEGMSDSEAVLLKRAARQLGVRRFQLLLEEDPAPDSEAALDVVIDEEGHMNERRVPLESLPTEEFRELELALGYTSGITVATSGAYILAGGNTSTMAALFLGSTATGLGPWLVPAALLLGGGVARTLVHLYSHGPLGARG